MRMMMRMRLAWKKSQKTLDTSKRLHRNKTRSTGSVDKGLNQRHHWNFWNCWKSIPAKLMPPYIRIKSLVMIYSWLFLSLIRRCKILFFSEIVENQYQPFCSSEIVNTSQAYATLYPYKTFGEDIFITFPLIDRTSSIFWVSKKLAVAAILFLKKCWKSIPAKLLTP